MSEICPVCGLPKELCVCEEIAMEEQQIKIFTTRRRFGKLMTILDGIDCKDIDLKDLCTQLKTKCACGGTVKDGKIELQGDQKRRVTDILVKMGYSRDMIDVK
jgi:translation initiation factor 1